jgi:glycosyltransferase involved in cell wall biosynthesis
LVAEHLARLGDDPSFEVILVNDGSQKPIGPALRQALDNLDGGWILANLPPSRYFRAGFARNVGAKQARGEFLIFLDSDILVREDFLTDLERQFQSGDVVQAKRWQIWLDERDKGLPEKLEEPNSFWFDFHTAGVAWMQMPQPWRYTSTYCLAMRRSDFVNLGGFRLWYSKYGFEDTDLGTRAHRRGLRLQRSESDVFHLAPHTRDMAYGHPARRRREGRRRESARKYFILNEVIGSLDWLIHAMV